MDYMKTYGRQPYKPINQRMLIKTENMRNRNVFDDDSVEDSPSDPFDKLFNNRKTALKRQSKRIQKKELKLNDENYELSSSTGSSDDFIMCKRNSKRKDDLLRKTLKNTTTTTTRKKVKKGNKEPNNVVAPYPDFSLIEKTELIIEDDFPSRIVPENTILISSSSNFQTPQTILKSSAKTKKSKRINWTSSTSAPTTPSFQLSHLPPKSIKKSQHMTTSTPNTKNINLPWFPKISPIITNSSVHSNVSNHKNLKECAVLLEKLSSSFLKNNGINDVDKLSNTFQRMSPFYECEKITTKAKIGNETNEKTSKEVSGKRSFSPSLDDLLRVSRRKSKIVKTSSNKRETREELKSYNRGIRKTSFLVSLTPLDCSFDGQSVCGYKTALVHCNQKNPVQIESFIRNITKIRKIGEGSYGEVYKGLDEHNEIVVIKIQAITDEKELMFDAVWPEIVSSCRLSELGNDRVNLTTTFVRVKDVVCLQGSYPKVLIKAWDNYNFETRSENIRPNCYDKNQLYVGYEIVDGGIDLEKFQINNCAQSLSIFLQVSSALAVAESALKFEHRDLHWGNILIAHTEEEKVEFQLNGKIMNINTQNVLVTIIDYSLSRVEEDGCVLYNDLNNADGIFSGTDDYQFDIYRKMKEVTRGTWKGFYPYTNILWLHYLLDKLCHVKEYKSKRRIHSSAKTQLKNWEKEILKYSSARDFVAKNEKYFQDF